jgi:arylsulfatase A-like enzyme
VGFHHPHPPLNPTRGSLERVKDIELPPLPETLDETGDKPGRLQAMLRQYAGLSAGDLADYRLYFAAMVAELDASVGLLMDFLEQEGILVQTLVIFTADHGDMCGDHHMISKGQHFYDPVMRVPLVVHWPEGIEGAGREVSGLVEMVDLLPTTLGLAGGSIPDHLVGRNLAPCLRQGNEPEPRQDVFAYSSPGMAMVRSAQTKYIRFTDPGGGEVLYDLVRDPGEQVNVVEHPPYAESRDTMRERLMDRLLTACVSGQEHLHPF